jgi:hypothetical protein
MSRDRAIRRYHFFSVIFGELPAHIRVQRNIQGLQLCPQAIEFFLKRVRRHVVIRTPKRAHVDVAQIARSLIAQFDHASVALAHRSANRVPAQPRALQFCSIAAGRHQLANRGHVKARLRVAVGTPLPPSIIAIQRGQNLRQFLLRFGIVGRREAGGQFQQHAFARKFGRKLHGVKPVCFFGKFCSRGIQLFIGIGSDLFRILGYKVFLNPRSARALHRKVEKVLLRPFDEFPGLLGAGCRSLRLSACTDGCK